MIKLSKRDREKSRMRSRWRSFVRGTFALLAAVSILSPRATQGAAGRIITGVEPGSGTHVKAFTVHTQSTVASFFAYPGFTGGVRVAAGDVTGDGGPDIITGTGPGAPAHIKVFAGSSLTLASSFFAYGTGFTGGVFVAAGDVNADGFSDIVTGVDAGALPHVKVFSGATGGELHSFFAYPVAFTGGVRVAAGDVNGDGRADIVTGAGEGGSTHVKVHITRGGPA